ncbi:MAG: helix-turn-helix domain-containing protein [Desulfovibrionaceae bacterium]|nr:helix-turn-helix domain-containing protein [Desulfovibrionaceae bacterium]
MKLLSTAEFAARIGVTAGRVRRLILDGRLLAKKIGRDWVISEKEIERIRGRKPGRPRRKK